MNGFVVLKHGFNRLISCGHTGLFGREKSIYVSLQGDVFHNIS
jgi:hypothetical protein